MASVRVGCPECNTEFDVAEADTGREVECPACRTRLRIDADPPADEPPPVKPPERDEDEPPRRKRPSAAESRNRDPQDDEPEGWRSSLPIRSPLPIVVGLAAFLAVAVVVIAAFWVATSFGAPPTGAAIGRR